MLGLKGRETERAIGKKAMAPIKEGSKLKIQKKKNTKFKITKVCKGSKGQKESIVALGEVKGAMGTAQSNNSNNCG